MTDPFIDPSGSLASGDASMSRIARSGLWAVLAHIFAAGSILAVSVIIGRSLGPSELGQYTFYMWILRVVPTVIALGVPIALTRFVAQKEGSAALGEAATLFRWVRRGHSLLMVVPAFALAGVVALAELALGVAVILLLGITVGLFALDYEALLAGLRRFRDLSIVSAILGLFQVGAALAGLALGFGWQGFLMLYVAAAAVGLLIMGGVGHRWVRSVTAEPLPSEDRKRFIRFSWAVALAVTTEAFLWGRPELIFLKLYRSDSDLGLYSTALRIASLASMIPLVAARTLLPEFSYQQAAGTPEHLQKTFRDVCRLLMVATAPMALGGLAVASGLVTTIYGPEFAAAGTAAGILLAGSLVNALAGPSAAAVFVGPRPRLVAEVGIAAVVLNALLDMLFIGRYGPEGAAAINVLVQSISVLIGMGYAWLRLDLRYPILDALRAVTLAGIAALVAYFVQRSVDGISGVGLAVVAGGVTYGVLVVKTGTIRIDELRRLSRGTNRT